VRGTRVDSQSDIATASVKMLTFAVTDLDRAFDFYKDVLGLKPVARWRHGAQFDLGNTRLMLLLTPERELAERETFTHVGLVVGGDKFVEISERVVDSGAELWHDSSSAQPALYFCDPDGHRIELLVQDSQDLSAIPLEAWDLIRLDDEDLEFFDE
jgi:catechol 2,3-dioxygenase-like lactoylglutathione lyase family enzyme